MLGLRLALPDAMTDFTILEGPGPIIATAIHDGHGFAPALAEAARIDAAARLREEDPYTGRLVDIAPTYLVAHRSRFEVDLNRPRDQSVYRSPEDAWGLDIAPRSVADIADALTCYDAFYQALGHILQQRRRFVVLDIHSYNHRRGGPDAAPDDPRDNPEVNLGTLTVGSRWGHLVTRFSDDLRAQHVTAAPLDVRLNVKFGGGHMSRWINQRFGDRGCAIAIELKKTFMDEWTGALDEAHLAALKRALAATLPGLLEVLG